MNYDLYSVVTIEVQCWIDNFILLLLHQGHKKTRDALAKNYSRPGMEFTGNVS